MPKFKHFCSHCKFLGNYTQVTSQNKFSSKKDTEYDLYYCTEHNNTETVFAVFGNFTSQSFDAPAKGKLIYDPLRQAARLAMSKGFLT